MYYDSHTHLNDPKVSNDWQTYLDNFVNIGGKGLVNIGVNEERNQKALSISRQCKIGKYSDIFVGATIGFHPSDCCTGDITHDNIDFKIANLEELYSTFDDVICGVGECGIDTHYENGVESLPTQKKLFARQADLARKWNLPLIIHSRQDFDSTMEVVERYLDLKIYFHCYGYGASEMKILIEKVPNLWVGFAGNVTYPKAVELREGLAQLPIENLLIETDAPYLSPQSKRGQVNEPSNVSLIYDFISLERQVPIEKLKGIVENNFKRLYFKG